MCWCMHAEPVAKSVLIPIDTKSRFVYIKGHLQGKHLLHQRTYSIDPFTVLATIFDWDKLTKIRYHGRNESLKISYVAKIESEDKAT